MQKINRHKIFFEVKVFDTLPKALGGRVEKLLKECFGTVRTPEKQAEHEDRYCSKQDRIGYVLARQENEVLGAVILLKREIAFKGKNVVLGGIGGVCTKKTKRRMGIATVLLGKAMGKLGAKGCDIAYLCADTNNPGMLRFYGQFGFVALNRPYTYLGKSGKGYTDHDGMIAPVKSNEIFKQVLSDKAPLDIGKGNW